MNASELGPGVANPTGTSEAGASESIAGVFDQIAGVAATGREVSIHGFGKFNVKDRSERQGRNPATRQAITIAASKKLTFAAGKGLKDKL